MTPPVVARARGGARRRTTLRYGPERGQVGDLWLPAGARDRVPVVVLVHGGYWRQLYTRRLMSRLAADVAARGWAAWNVEYRRVGRFGTGRWPDPLSDVRRSLAHVGALEGVDPERVAVCGHSAGATLALCAAVRREAEPPPPGSRPVALVAAVSLAGVLDLVEGSVLDLGGGAVRSLLGGGPDDVPDRYAVASPLALVPLGVDQVIVHGDEDAVVPPAMSRRYAEAATRAGDRVTLEAVPGQGHLSMIDPGRPGWRRAVSHLERLFGEA